MPGRNHDIENIRQRAKRLLEVAPLDVLNVLQKVVIKNKTVIEADGAVKIVDKRITILPDNLPLGTPYYTEIHDKQEELRRSLSIASVVVISGIGGMGKTTLAAEYGREYKERGGQVLWLKGMQIEEEFLQLAKNLGVETQDQNPEMVRDLVYGRFSKLSKNQPILLIFDNVDEKGKIEKYLKNLPNRVKVLVTSRNRNLLQGIKPINMTGFGEQEAIYYLRKALSISDNEARKIVATVSKSPFRLSKTIDYLEKNSFVSIEKYIDDYEAIKKGHDQNEDIYPEVEMLFRSLKNDSTEGWRLLKYFVYLDAEGVPLELIASIMGCSEAMLQLYVNELGSLINVLTENNQKILKVSHRLIQDEMQKALSVEDRMQIPKILEKLIGDLNRVFPNPNKDPQNWEKATKLVNHAKRLIEKSKESNLLIIDRETLLSKIGNYYYHVSFDYKKAIYYWKECLDYQILRGKNNHPDVALSLNNIGIAYEALGGEENIRIGLGYYQDALRMRQFLFPGNHLDVASSLNDIGIAYQALGGEENILRGLNYKKDALKMRQALFSGNSMLVAQSLNNVGTAYRLLGGEKNIRKALKYLENALKMKQVLFSNNHPDVANCLSNIGLAYETLGGEENVRKALTYQEDALKMRQALFPGNHPDVANSLNRVGTTYRILGGEENIRKALKCHQDSLKMQQALFSENHPAIANSLNSIGIAYQALGGEENIRKAVGYMEDVLKMTQALFPGNSIYVAMSLNNIAAIYQKLGREENIRKGLIYEEGSLKIMQTLFFSNHPDIARSLNNIGTFYKKLGDTDKALEYFKQSYVIYSALFNDDYEKVKKLKRRIQSLQPKFFKEKNQQIELESRWIIMSRGEVSDHLIMLKQKIQKDILNNIVQTTNIYGWSSGILSDWGVKGYTDNNYLKRKLDELSNNNENIEIVQMLCFESMNLGIMKLEKKPYEVVESFTKEYPKLVRKIAEEHPEFFVDGSIVEACIRAMPDQESKEYFNHVKYMGMDERREKGFIDI